MDIETRNKYCGLLMFNTAPNKNSSEFIMDSYTFDQPEPYYKSQNSDSQETSIAAGAADATTATTFNKDDNNDNNKNNNNKSKTKTEKSPPRPPNAFILYRREKQPAILATHRHLSNAQISRYIASLWRNESNETRLKWERFADQTKLEHMKAFPNYVYRPNKKEKNEKRKNKQIAANAAVSTYASSTAASVNSSFDSTVSPNSDIFSNNQMDNTIGPIRFSSRGQHRFNIIDRPQMTTNYTSMPTDITSFYDPSLMSIGYTDVPTSAASSISDVSSAAASSSPEQINQINDFSDHIDLWKIVPSQHEQQLSGNDFSFVPTTIPTSTSILTTIPTTIPTIPVSTASNYENTIIDPSIVYCNSNDNSFYNDQQQSFTTTLPPEFDNYSFFNC